MNRRQLLQIIFGACTAQSLYSDDNNSVKAKYNFICFSSHLGFNLEELYPKENGKISTENMPLNLAPLKDVIQDCTVISGLKNHQGSKGHYGANGVLTGIGRSSEKFTIIKHKGSLDYYVAKNQTSGFAVPHLRMANDKFLRIRDSLTWDDSGLFLPSSPNSYKHYERLVGTENFRNSLNDNKTFVDIHLSEIKRSLKDYSGEQLDSMKKYMDELHGVNKDINKTLKRLTLKNSDHRNLKPPEKDLNGSNGQVIMNLKTQAELALFALQTGYTSVVTITAPQNSSNPVLLDGKKLSSSTHSYSHRAQDGSFMDIGIDQISILADLIAKLKKISLLDKTIVMITGGMENAKKHSSNNLPVILAGGPFKHGSFHKIDPEKADLASLLQHIGRVYKVPHAENFPVLKNEIDWQNVIGGIS